MFGLSVVLAAVSVLGPYSAAGNFAVNLKGQPDTRPGCYGLAEAWSGKITFTPPAGYRVRILRVYGDYVVMPQGVGPVGTSAGTLFSLQTTAQQGSTQSDYMASNTMLYYQQYTDGHPGRVPYDTDVHVGGLLEPDNVLVVNLASWLNTMGVVIHIEPSFTATYVFEKEEAGR